jgi:hypothetical protein
VSAKFLIRFDDICPTMNWDTWNRLEEVLDEARVKPIVAIVPDNRDNALVVDPPSSDFWTRARAWQAKGWQIGMHGYQHTWESTESGLLGLNRVSEFAGLSAAVQHQKLSCALELFRQHGLDPQVWVAPAHSFDETTVRILHELGLRIISDGFFWRPVYRFGCIWIPQQLWRLRPLPFGVWTVCYHPNSFAVRDVDELRRDFFRYRKRIVSLEGIVSQRDPTPFGRLDKLGARLWLGAVRVRRAVGHV